jgi:hypothetical protein
MAASIAGACCHAQPLEADLVTAPAGEQHGVAVALVDEAGGVLIGEAGSNEKPSA